MKGEAKEEEGVGFSRLASFVYEYEPLSQEDLEAIEASLQSSLPTTTITTTITTTSTTTTTTTTNNNNKRPITSHSPTRRSRRRLPTSLIALQLPRSPSFSPSPGLTSSSAFYFSILICIMLVFLSLHSRFFHLSRNLLLCCVSIQRIAILF